MVMKCLPPTPVQGAAGGAVRPGADDHAPSSRSAAFAQVPKTYSVSKLRRNLRSRHPIDRLWRPGPRPVGELLLEITLDHGIEHDILARSEVCAALDPAAVARRGARHWPSLPLEAVA
jgi:hypothetical protein